MGYAADEITLTAADATAMLEVYDRDPMGFRAYLLQFQARFRDNRIGRNK